MNLTKPQKLIYDMEKFAGGAVAVICGSMLICGKKDLSELKTAVNEVYRLNDALRIRISETNGEVSQIVTEYTEQEIEVLCFEDKAALDLYAEKYAKIPLDFYNNLCEVNIVILPKHYGVLVKLHHIVGDAWTIALLISQFNELLKGNEIETYSYTEYVNSEDEYINSSRFNKDRAFFLEQFKKCDEATYISEKKSDTFSAKRKAFVISQKNAKSIFNYANQNNTSVFILFMTALSIYFNRTNRNAEKFYIGTAVLNRLGIREKNTAGMFVNTVPMLIELNNAKSFAENIAEVKKTALSIFRHQKYNYDDVLSAVRKEYGFTEKLYDVMISYQNATINGTDIETTWYHSGVQSESLQIHIDDRDNEGIYRIHYDYQTEKFTEHEIDMLHSHITNLLFDGMKNSSKKIYELNLLTESERQKLLFDFNDTAVDYPKDKCVHQLFEEQAEKTPYKNAVIACDKTLTYAELNEQANRIAHSLIEKGVRQGDIVAFMLPRRSYLIAAMLGILKSGAAYLPIDPDYPQDRIEYMLEDSKAKFCVTEDNIKDLLSNLRTGNPNIAISSESLCYCIYTSGSTGQPKGTLLTHGNVVNYVNNNSNNVVHRIIKESYRNIVSVTTVGFDIFVTESLLPLANGMEILFANEEQAKLQSKLNDLIKSKPADVIQTTPTKMKSLIADKSQLDYLKTVKAIILGGEVLDNSLVEELKRITNAEIFNIYGPTEATVWVTSAEINDTDITIGKPIANTQIYIVDKYMQLTPIGVAGELCIAGDGVGSGYLDRHELTAEKFIDNPFGEGKLYKTGDFAYWREDGNIVYVGRNDFQVKIRGLRIELGEIENAISSVDEVSQSVVIVRKDETGRQLICAFYTEKEPVDLSVIKNSISKKLPKYMMPHIFTKLNEMPLTSSGKVNRKALLEVNLNNISSGVEYIAPVTEKQCALVSAIKEVLNIEKVGIKDNFFDLGGDSLKSIELMAKLEKSGYKTEIKAVFNSDTIEALAEELILRENIQEDFDLVAGDISATSAQMRVYTAQNMQSGSTMYNVPYVFKTKGISIDKLQNAIDKIIARHESLRTHFENKDGKIIQIIDDNAKCIVKKLESGNISDFIRPFDLFKAPLLRVGIYENIVMIDMHHIITDGNSMPIFLKELNELYMDRMLDEKPVQYRHFAVQGEDLTQSEKYWESIFNDEFPVLEINTDYPRKYKQSFNGSAIYETIDISLHNQICEKCKELNITPFVYYMGAFNILLSKFSNNEDIIVGMPMSGRKPKYLNTIGMFVNTVALRNQPKGTKSVKEFLDEVKNNSLKAFEHQDYPYGDLVKKLKIETNGRNPLFDVMLAYQAEKMTDIVFGDEKAEILPIPVTTSKYDFTFNVMPRNADVVIMAEYCTDLFRESTVQRFVNGYKQVLSQMLDAAKTLCSLSVISHNERQKLLFDFNDTAVDYPKDKCVHQLFEEQAEKTPYKNAVIACDKTLTYAELNEQANRIAHSLIEKGVQQGDIVAFMLPRRSYLIAAMLGILKSGAAYLPIDPDYPQDRIDFMLEDSKAKYCVTEENIYDLLGNSCTDNPDIAISSESLCYCIYTSGSTGKPKGTLLRHSGIINLVTNLSIFKDLSKCERFGFMTTITFDVATQEILTSLLNGFTGILMPERKETRAEEIIAKLEQYEVDVIFATPTYFDSLTNTEDKAEKLLKTVKVISLAGEKFEINNIVKQFSESYHTIFENQYGPVELHVIATATTVTNGDYDSIGKPVGNDKAYIVDNYMNITPIGVTGELCIAGDGVGAGYLNRPELTAEKFIDNPFGEGKLYKTGDLAYWREDGNIVYVGRNDFQVKIRGLRIELGEIENAICGIDGISQAVVVVRKNNDGRQLICAFYTGTEKDAKDIRRIISQKLPQYMLPHIFTHLENLPMTTSGKINRKALPEISLENISNDTEYVAPENHLQKECCKLIESVLGTTPVGITDDFFDLGGDSLKAIEFVSKAHNEGIYFNLQNVFDYPTVRALCDCIKNGDKQDVSFADVDFSAVNRILAKNKTGYITVPSKTDVGNILLAGATGYLGIHILANFLDNDSGIAYCLVRGKDKADSTMRLKELLDFYFGDKYTDMHRIEVISADLQKNNFGLSDAEYGELASKVDTVINCAASVKHYGSYRYFYEVNVETTTRLISFCKAADAKLIHTSTLSVSGNTFVDSFDRCISESEKHFYESSLYIGQPLDNVYGRSKFEAEKAVLEAMADGLKANIMRMGNLTNRLDGMFQKNHESNAFLKRVKSVLEIGVFPDYLMDLYAEFTPIDEAANAVMTIARNFSTEQTVFHVNSIKIVYFDKLLKICDELGFCVRTVSGAEFTEVLRQTAKRTGMEHIFETFINDMDENDKLNYDSNIRIENDFTVQYLKLLGFEWSDIGIDYIRKYVEYFKKIGYME